MPRHSPYEIHLSPEERKELLLRASSYSLQYSKVIRAKMILLAAQGLTNHEIAERLATRREVVSRWRKRFFEKRLAGLETAVRTGRPASTRNVLQKTASS
jgi:DNA-binding CsgD family transcriptional regulator